VNLGEGGLVENDYFTANCSMPRSFAACADFRAGWWHGRPARVFLVRHSPNFRGHTRARPVPLLFGCRFAAESFRGFKTIIASRRFLAFY